MTNVRYQSAYAYRAYPRATQYSTTPQVRVAATTTQDLVNDLCDTLEVRKQGKLQDGGFIFERIALQGMFETVKAHNLDDDSRLLLLSPYLETYYDAQNRVNEAVKALARALKVRAVTSSHKFSLKPSVRNCNTACLYAVGDDCTCGCGGVNHGMERVRV